MKRRYGTRSAGRLWEKSSSEYSKMADSLIYSMGIGQVFEKQEIMVELQILFFKNFHSYENEKQYKNFMFICLKNTIRNMQRTEFRHRNRFTNDFTTFSSLGNEVSYSDAWNTVSDERDDYRVIAFMELVEKLKESVSETARIIVDKIIEGFSIEQIARQLNSVVSAIRKCIEKEIKPAFIMLTQTCLPEVL